MKLALINDLPSSLRIRVSSKNLNFVSLILIIFHRLQYIVSGTPHFSNRNCYKAC